MYHTVGLRITMENEAQAVKAVEVITELASKRTSPHGKELVRFAEDLWIEDNMVLAEESASLFSDTFLDFVPEIMKACAFLTEQKFEANAWYEDYGCGLEESIEAKRNDTSLNIRTVVSENGNGMCPECGEHIVCYDEYDPNETYYCPICGKELVHEEMFLGILPVTTLETLIIA